MRSSTLAALTFAVVQVAAMPPACLLACVSRVSREKDVAMKQVSQYCSDHADAMQDCLQSICPSGQADAGVQYFQGVCKDRGVDVGQKTSSSSTASSSTASSSTPASSSVPTSSSVPSSAVPSSTPQVDYTLATGSSSTPSAPASTGGASSPSGPTQGDSTGSSSPEATTPAASDSKTTPGSSKPTTLSSAPAGVPSSEVPSVSFTGAANVLDYSYTLLGGLVFAGFLL